MLQRRKEKVRREKDAKQPIGEEKKVSNFSLQTDSGSKSIEDLRLKRNRKSR